MGVFQQLCGLSGSFDFFRPPASLGESSGVALRYCCEKVIRSKRPPAVCPGGVCRSVARIHSFIMVRRRVISAKNPPLYFHTGFFIRSAHSE
jgi:hypothetical protein